MIKIAIAGVTGFRNRGVEALVVPTVSKLIQKYPACRIQIASWSPAYDRHRIIHPSVEFVHDNYLACGNWVRPRTDSETTGKKNLASRLLRKIRRRIMTDDRGAVKQYEMPFSEPDLLLVSGGDLYSSDYGTNSLRHFISPILWANSRGIPCVLLGQSVGRFNSETDLSLWKSAASCSSLVLLREELSRDYLVSELKSDCSNIVVTADTGFLLEPNCDYADNCDWLADSNVVAVSISESISKWTNTDYEKHFDNWKAVIRHMINEWGVKVAVIPHVQETFSDDRLLSTRIARELRFDGRLRVFSEDLTAAEYKGIISKCQFVVAERMHAAIAGFSSGVCTVPIGYSIKAEGITGMMIRGSDYIASEVSMSLPEFLDLDRAIARLNNLWRSRGILSGAIGSNLPGVVTDAERSFDLIDKNLNAQGLN